QEAGFVRLRALIQKKGWFINVVHAYDSNVAYIGMLIAWVTNAKFCLTKCGGPPPKYFFPSVLYLFVFHPADYEYFSSRRSFRCVKLLPHRVSPPRFDAKRAERLFGRKCKEKLVIFRVGRIGRGYKYTIINAINLVDELNSRGVPSELKVIGYL